MYNNYVQQKDSRESAEIEKGVIQTRKRMVGPGWLEHPTSTLSEFLSLTSYYKLIPNLEFKTSYYKSVYNNYDNLILARIISFSLGAGEIKRESMINQAVLNNDVLHRSITNVYWIRRNKWRNRSSSTHG